MQLKPELKEFEVNLPDYNFERQLKAANYGNVYLASYVDSQKGKQPCVIKQLAQRRLDQKHQESFFHEIEVSSKCSSPYIVKFLGFQNKYPYSLIYEYLGSGNLNTFVYKRRLELSPTEKTIVAIGVAYSMRALHERGIIHSDLSSWNVLLDKDLVPKVIISRASHFVDENCDFIGFGQPSYMAPERLKSGKDREETQKSDVFSYGVLLRELLTGQRPFENMTYGQIRAQWELGQRLRVTKDMLEGPLAEMIESCLAMKAAERPTFSEIVDMFKKQVKEMMFPEANPQVVQAFVNVWDRAERFEKSVRVTKYNEYMTSLRDDVAYDSLMEAVLRSKTNAKAFMRAATTTMMIHEDIEHRKRAALELMYVLRADPELVKLFVSTKLYEKCLENTGELAKYYLSVLLPVFSVCPEVATGALIDKVEEYFPVAPVKVLRLYETLSQSFTEESFGWNVVDSLLCHASVFFDTKAMYDYILVIYSLVARFKCFRNERSNVCIVMFRRCIDSSNENLVKLGYSILTSLEITEVNDPSVLVKHFENDALRPSVLRYLTVVKVDTVSPSIIPMFVQSSEVKLVSCVLWRFARSQHFFDAVISVASFFTLMEASDLMKLLLVLMIRKEQQATVAALPHLPEILLHIAKSGNSELLMAVCSMVRRFPVTPDFVARLDQSGFIAEYIAQCARINSPEMYYNCCLLVDFLLRVAFAPSFKRFLPVIIKNLTSSTQYQTASLSVLVLYSGRPVGRKHVLEMKAMDVVNGLTLQPDSAPIVAKLKKNLKV